MVKQGYKKTEIGVIPEDWEIEVFSNVSFMKGRIGWQGLKQTEFTNNDNEPFLITGMNFKEGKIRWDEVYHVSEDRYEIAKEIQLRPNDVLMTKDGTIGKMLFVDEIPYPNKATLNSHLLLFRPLKNKYVSKYLYYNLQFKYFLNHIEENKSGTTFYGISQEAVGKYKIPLPPLAEQEAIAAALSDADVWIESLEQLIAKKRLIKQGALQELLKPKEGWELKMLGEVCEILNNKRIPIKESERVKGYTPYYGANGIQGYIEGFTHDGECVLVAEDGANDLNNYPINYTVGRIWVNNHAHVLQGKSLILGTRFLSYLLKSIDFQNVLVGGTRAKLNKSVLEQIEIPFPSLSEQERIATILSDMDKELGALENQLTKARQIKQGMMQELLTGRVRLV